MRRETVLAHEFVEFIPDDLKERTIYVSIDFATVAHKCCCGCGKEVITPLSPTDWELIFDGKTISLDPSIGNWGFDCQSHYWIRNNKVRWAARWSPEKIDAGRAHDTFVKEQYLDSTKTLISHDENAGVEGTEEAKTKENLWRKLKKLLFS